MKLTFIYRRWENSMRGFMSMVCGHWFAWEGSISLATNQQPGLAKPHCKADRVRGFGPFFHWLFGWQIDSFRAEGVIHCQVTRVACFFSCMVKVCVWERERERERERGEAEMWHLSCHFRVHWRRWWIVVRRNVV
jgi:hypothetical protein